ncbi:hypothetical protein EMIHUDRAFT_465504 [Emiliania huxleyi CCMP1516]|uniref:Uncharacterized protein n=2 Tax=Emiliania huxleyi TaxID=2903 RepID=A0A0D3IC89_EMIH1|nr:hypothetical protein EMIHUDRAFT_465504 [Emiliania huxleyi CCMP1516]EOD08874.1 hypothetical protein EMIHUDRAFT_465504 [Emiliania huxleyi CCMP1516]|eukprot:XP_005761303.1 hypothetical protein EMIHUDRAFT_465504 [Emiliania huxleyi CCMP1516]
MTPKTLPPQKRAREEAQERDEADCSGGCGERRAAAAYPAEPGPWRCTKCEKLIGCEVIARRGREYERGVVQQRDRNSQLLVQWWEEAATGSNEKGLAPEWVAERHAALAAPADGERVRRGMAVLAEWVDGRFYCATVQGGAAQARVLLQFEDGLRYEAGLDALRPLLDKPLLQAAHSPPSSAVREPRSSLQRMLPADLPSARAAGYGPLAQSMDRLEAVWRCSGAWRAEHEAALSFFELASILQRIDFGLEEMTAEGVAAQSKSFTRAIGRHRQRLAPLPPRHQQRLIQLLEARMRQVFALAGLWRECHASLRRGVGACGESTMRSGGLRRVYDEEWGPAVRVYDEEWGREASSPGPG